MSNLDQFLLKRQSEGRSLTLVTGVFDVLHQEHRNFLVKARATADLLVIGLESDLRVRQMKGEGRPINKQAKRLTNLKAWDLADFIFILPEQFSKPDDHRRLIGRIKPDFLAVSSHTSHQREKAAILAEFGAKLVVVHDFNPGFSSSQIINERQAQEKKGDL